MLSWGWTLPWTGCAGKALRTLKKKWTTRTNAADLEKRQKAERMIALLNEASRILCNKEDRADYDRKLNREKNKQTAPTINTETPAPVMPTGSGAEALISMAESFYEHGSYQQALETAAKALQAGIDDPRLFNVVSMCYAENGDYERAYATMYDAVARTQDPDMKARLIFLCLRLYQMPQRARALLDEMLHDYPDTNMLVAYDVSTTFTRTTRPWPRPSWPITARHTRRTASSRSICRAPISPKPIPISPSMPAAASTLPTRRLWTII